jgi:hypothetical protein
MILICNVACRTNLKRLDNRREEKTIEEKTIYKNTRQ